MFLGELKAAWSLDREEKGEYHLTITAEDLGPDVQLPGSADVRIQLQDVNDNPPVLTNIPPVLYVPDSITEGNCSHLEFSQLTICLAGGLVYQLDVEDKDAGANSRLQFYLSGPASSYFNLESTTGRLTSRRALQRGSQHQLQIEVFDSGKPALSTKEQLTISVADSDLFPKFSSSVNEVSIKEAEKTAGKSVPHFATS